MTLTKIVHAPGLLTRAQAALSMSQEAFGMLIGCSRRTMVRYQKGDNGPSVADWHLIARHVQSVDSALAGEIARETGETLETLGLVERVALPTPPAAPPVPPTRPSPPTRDLVDSIVCAAAEAVSTTPQDIRPALRAAFDRAASLGLAIEEVREVLRPRPSAKARTTARKRGEPKGDARRGTRSRSP